MEALQKIDEYFFRLINSAGWEQMDQLMILISSVAQQGLTELKDLIWKKLNE